MHPESPLTHTDRRRADSFGSAAEQYDRCRPRYPRRLIAELVTRNEMTVLDVGAGTGIASSQLLESGADVLAVEPDRRMASVARSKGLSVEEATFEAWDPADRTFDLVVFAQSFHWVEPRQALSTIATILRAGGRLVLLANRIRPISPTSVELDGAYSGILDISQRPSIDAAHEVAVASLIEECGFGVERRCVVEQLHYATDEWLDMVTTYSNVLTLESHKRVELRARLEERIGAHGVDAQNDAVALICTPHSSRSARGL